jgi:peptidoglycan/xylan/chitin deacetylase (PgdA/CDA1 family)
MVEAIQNLVRSADAAVARLYLSMFRERGALVSFLFHSLFRNQAEIDKDLVEPLQRTTVAQLRTVIEYYQEHEYRFISPNALLDGSLDPDGRYVLLTFDDGYYNNVLSLPLLERYAVPALFFISTDHVQQNKCFWWDVMYRERRATGATRKTVYQEILALKHLRTEQIEVELTRRFGPDAFTPRGDIDRPFSVDELRDFARSPLVHLGNHTAGHGILTNYTPAEMRGQIDRCQAALREITGVTPTAISYPNGGFDDCVVETARQAGLKLGFTIRPSKVPLPTGCPTDQMRLGRFIPHGGAPTLTQCRTCRSDVTVYGTCRQWYLRMARGKVSA